jgi:putative ABC transport system substrate-binding protein
MNRRDTLRALLGLAAGTSAEVRAAEGGAPRRLVLLSSNSAESVLKNPAVAALWARMDERLKSLGWQVGRNLRLDRYFSEGISERLPLLLAEAMREPIDVILAIQTSAAVAAARATQSIPIVLVGASAYPVECGLIQSFARPGGNVTGISFFQGIVVQSKLAQFVREILPDARRLAWIACPADLVKVGGGEFRPEPYYAQVAHDLGFELGYYECRTPEDFDAAFAALARWGARAVIVEPAALSFVHANRIAGLALRAKLPSLFSLGFNAQAGGLMSYGPSYVEVYDQAVVYTDRLLHGARAAELPVEMPRKLELILNRKTARMLGLSIPQSILVGADTVLE